jgi:endonuclease/exonuclease/phosphatase family metal-dependent hydrolase
MLSVLFAAATMTLPCQFVDPIQVMSFNIRFGTAEDGDDHWKFRKPRTLEALQRRLPGLIGLQEALDFQVEEVCQALSAAFVPGTPKGPRQDRHYRFVGVGRDDGRSKGEFSAIVYDAHRFQVKRSDTFWLSETPSVPDSKHWGNGITRICTWAHFYDRAAKRHFYLFNTHLDHQSQASREEGIALILSRIKERGTDDPVLITGDLNVGESNAVIAQIKQGGLFDTFRKLYPDETNVGTFGGFRDIGKEKIDYVFSDSAWTVEKAELVRDKVDGRWISDHLPVVAWVKLR